MAFVTLVLLTMSLVSRFESWFYNKMKPP